MTRKSSPPNSAKPSRITPQKIATPPGAPAGNSNPIRQKGTAFVASHSIMKRKTPKLSRLLPERIAKLLGDRPTTCFEDDEEFDMIHAEMILAHDPRDLQEHFIVRDITDAQWQVMRLREMASAAVEVKLPDAMMKLVGGVYMYSHGCKDVVAHRDLTSIVRGALLDASSSNGALDRVLRISGVSHRHLKTEAFSLALPTIASISDLITSAEKRRDKAIRRLEERRKYMAAMSSNLPATDNGIIDVISDDTSPEQQHETEEQQAALGEAEAQVDGDAEEDEDP